MTKKNLYIWIDVINMILSHAFRVLKNISDTVISVTTVNGMMFHTLGDIYNLIELQMD